MTQPALPLALYRTGRLDCDAKEFRALQRLLEDLAVEAPA
jgi:hypothetical protein